jgi:hypothetical protein
MRQTLAFFFVGIVLLLSEARGQNLATFSDIRPAMKNKNIEKAAVFLANQKSAEWYWPEDYKKAVIISDKWSDIYDKFGRLKGQKINMVLYGEMPDGKGVLTDFTFIRKLKSDEKLSDYLSYYSVGDMVYAEAE